LISRISPSRDLLPGLLGVQKPARYSGGEFGITRKEEASFRVGLGFPDLYEIGMSNLAVRILYNRLNALQGVACERFFAPAPDFESFIKRLALPLYGLDSGTPLASMDIVAFSLGYELCGTGIISSLDLAGIPILASERRMNDPIVIAGGPATANPHPFAPFFDGIWIGEAEAGFFDLVSEMSTVKGRGGNRDDVLELIDASPSFWRKGKKARRAVSASFGRGESFHSVLPVPSLRPVMDHGMVEIMRGCPNGCRFCHAGYAYRPTRCKDPVSILEECLRCVEEGGYREISLSSLSSADYPGIGRLVSGLSSAFSDRGVSFQLPSLRIDSFTLPLLDSLSDVRKSGITLAVETPSAEWRRKLNKPFDEEKVFSILSSAQASGWRRAKLYFMIGLPVGGGPEEEAEKIDSFIADAARRFRMEYTVNVGVFIPKPHTPFERMAQADPERALQAMKRLKASVPRSVKLSYHDPALSYLEGLVSRGDEEIASLFLAAHRLGQRLEAWDEHRDAGAWKAAVETLSPEARGRPARGFPEGDFLPWSDVNMGISPSFFASELKRAEAGELTPSCVVDCEKPCGACSPSGPRIERSFDLAEFEAALARLPPPPDSKTVRYRIVFRFTKEGRARFLSHLSLIEALSKASLRASLPIVYTQGFNPQPRIEILQALSLGVESVSEIASVFLSALFPDFEEAMNHSLPEGIRILASACIPVSTGDKIESLNALPYACVIEMDPSRIEGDERVIPCGNAISILDEGPGGKVRYTVEVGTGAERQAFYFIKNRFGADASAWPPLKRVDCFTVNPLRKGEWISFFDYFSRNHPGAQEGTPE
jgi:radical SAM superfamily enzyme YgiQ (UPF0313 family)